MFAGMALAKILYIAIQPNQILGQLFWQKMLDKMFTSKHRFLRAMVKPLGECELCFSHLMMVASFVMYTVLCTQVFHIWILDFVHHKANTNHSGHWVLVNYLLDVISWIGDAFIKGLVVISWYLFYIAGGTWISMYWLIHKRLVKK